MPLTTCLQYHGAVIHYLLARSHILNTLKHKGCAREQNMTDIMQPAIFNKHSDSSDWWAPNEFAETDRSISRHHLL